MKEAEEFFAKVGNQLTEKQAIAFYKSDVWKDWDHEQIVRFQLFNQRLAVPFDRFHEAIEAVLGRPVFTHEIGLNYMGLVNEYLGQKPAPTFDEILELIPADKRIIIFNHE